MNTKELTGISHDVHVRKENGEIEDFSGVLDVMKLPDGKLKFTHNGNLKEYSNGEVIRSRVKNVEDAHKYICPECESDEAAMITASDYGETLKVACGNCTHFGFERREL